MWQGEMRSHFANRGDIPPTAFTEPLIQRITLPPPPTSSEVAAFSQASPDTLNPGIAITTNGTPERRQPSFVDDTGVAHIRSHFITAAAASVHAAYTMFGHPTEDPNRPPCINPSKWHDKVYHHLQFLGYHIDTRKMIVAWPLEKRQKLSIFLDAILAPSEGASVTPHSISRVLGLLRHAAPVAPMGIYRSLRLQFLFNDILTKAPTSKQLRRWYQRRSVQLPPSILQELREFQFKLSTDIHDPYWCRSIGLLIPRVPTITVFTDASTTALGGWSRHSELNHMWRLTVIDLREAGIPANTTWNNKHNFHEPDLDPLALHINILEFIAIIIELWICVRQIHQANTTSSTLLSSIVSEAPASPLPPGGHRLLVRADNTSALSWLRYATRTKRAPVRRLARLLTSFLSQPFAASSIRIQGKHLAGVVNVSADHLSRFAKSASWAAVMANCPNLRHLRICLLPAELLSLIVYAFLQERTEEWYETATTRLLTIAPPAFVTGSLRPVDTTTSVVRVA
jgi:hypothetical protein